MRLDLRAGGGARAGAGDMEEGGEVSCAVGDGEGSGGGGESDAGACRLREAVTPWLLVLMVLMTLTRLVVLERSIVSALMVMVPGMGSVPPWPWLPPFKLRRSGPESSEAMRSPTRVAPPVPRIPRS